MKMTVHDKGQYGQLATMVVLSFISMYILMYAMVNVFGNVFSSLNQFYMAGLMTMPMIVIEVALMRSMYSDKKMNTLIIAGSIVVFLLCWFGIRQQAGIGDKQFLRSMIPHHAGAILMCEQASLKDPEVRKLCEGIITGQQAEIDLMKAKLEQLK